MSDMGLAAPKQSQAGFLARLFDTSFEQSITLSIIRVAYILFIIADAVYALGIFVGLAAAGKGGGAVLGLIVAPIVFLVSLIWVRFIMEAIVALHHIARNTREVADRAV